MTGLREVPGAARSGHARSSAHAATRSSLGGLVLVVAAWAPGCTDQQPAPLPPQDAGPGPSVPGVDAQGVVPGNDATPFMDSGVSSVGMPPDAAAPGSGGEVDAGVMAPAPEAATPPPGPAARRSLVEPYSWEVLGADEDPFEDRPQGTTVCESAEGVKVEDLMGQDTFEVNTGFCSYVTARQTSLADVAAGETLKARVWHYSLTGPDGSWAHVVLQIGDQPVVEEMFPIPGPGGLSAVEVPVETALPAGTPVYFHIHNHGENTYSMVELTAGPAT